MNRLILELSPRLSTLAHLILRPQFFVGFLIELTLTSPQELKIKPGEQLTPGQVLSDRTVERERLLNQKKQLELSLKKLDTPISTITSLSVISPLQQLPKISDHSEQANINLKQQELRETQKAIALSYEKIKQISKLLPPDQEKTQQLAFVVSSSNLVNSFNPEKDSFHLYLERYQLCSWIANQSLSLLTSKLIFYCHLLLLS